jgi:putative peptidoglycan lipid II flippase
VSLYRNFFNVGSMTLLSRLLGFVRDMLMAVVLGTGPAADAFFAAFRFPNLFRRLFAEGAFNAAFIPMFSKALAEGDQEAARIFAGRILSWLIGFLLVLTALAEIFMPYVLVPFVPGFLDDPAKFELTVFLTRICFPYLACMSLMAAYGGILNSFGRFFEAAAAPVLLNIVLVGLMGALVLLAHDDPVTGAVYVSWGTLAGGAAQLALVWWAVTRTGFVPKFTLPRFDPEVRRFWLLALPAILTGGVIQINIFIGTIIASQADSAISYLYYADRLYQLPLGIIGIAIGVVLLPELSGHLKNNRPTEAAQAQDQSLTLSMLLSVPAAAALFALAGPIISVLFERGAFGAEAASATSNALMAFALGLPAFVLVKVFQPGFFAREDTLTPTIFAAISVVVNVGLSLALFPTLQHVGIAVATSASAWVNVALLAGTLLRRDFLQIRAAQWRQQGLILGLSVGMAVALWFTALLLAPALVPGASVLVQFLALGLLVVAGLLIYFGLAHLTGVQRLSRLAQMLKRG